MGSTKACDLVIIGGGLAGASLGRVMALSGFDVIILEKETTFRDRVRGEVLLPGEATKPNYSVYMISYWNAARENFCVSISL
jgi:flavin-dependent dehydrogenase